MSSPKASYQVQQLNDQLMKLLADKANLDERIAATRNILTGVQLGSKARQEEFDRRAAEEQTPEE